MQGIVHIFSVHSLDKQADGSDHHHRVRGLNGDYHIVELFTTEDAQELHTTFNDSFRSIAVAAHDAVGERTMIDTDAYCGMMLLTYINKRYELGLNFL